MGYLILQDAIGKAHFDYIEKWKDAGEWTYDIPKWDIFERETDNLDNMCLSSFEILQHKLNLEKIIQLEFTQTGTITEKMSQDQSRY